MKPTTTVAMINLIKEARTKIPFNLSFEGNCEGRCDECPFKLMEYLDIDLGNWEERLKHGVVPTAGELHTLGRACIELYELLQKKGFMQKTI